MSFSQQKNSTTKLKRTFSGTKFYSKAKETTKSLVHQVLLKKMSSQSSLSSSSSSSQLPLAVTIDSKPYVFEPPTHRRHHSLKSFHKRLSIKRRTKSDSDDSYSEATTITSNNAEHQCAVAAAQADILSGSERPGSFALACDCPVANEKQSVEFHELFKSVPEEDVLIQCYGCALQRHILHQGRLYVSEHFVCFKSNIFGVVTNLVINFNEIIRVEKRMTAKIIPNGIVITTNTSTHIFASFRTRDQTYDQIVKIWDLNKRANSAKQHRSSMEQEAPILITDTLIPIAPIINNNEYIQKRPRSISDTVDPHAYNLSKLTKYDVQPSVYEKIPKVCPCTINGEHYTHVALNDTFTGTVESMTKILFNSSFMKIFLERYENFEDIQLGDWKHGNRLVTGKRKVKSSTTGTRMINFRFQDEKIHKKFPYYNCISTVKSMPDVPIGAVYSIKTRTCIRRVTKDQVHVKVTFEIVFSKNGLISSIIENNAADDQLRLYRHLASILKKPELLRELIKEKSILRDLQLETTSTTTKSSQKRRMPRAIQWVYIAMFIVIVTHCILALRLRRISNKLQDIQPKDDPIQWILRHPKSRNQPKI